jgi:hypothetical protein
MLFWQHYVRPAGQDDCRKSIKETKFCDLRFYSTVSRGVTKGENKRDFQGCELFSVETVFIDQKTSRVQKVGVPTGRVVIINPDVLQIDVLGVGGFDDEGSRIRFYIGRIIVRELSATTSDNLTPPHTKAWPTPVVPVGYPTYNYARLAGTFLMGPFSFSHKINFESSPHPQQPFRTLSTHNTTIARWCFLHSIYRQVILR